MKGSILPEQVTRRALIKFSGIAAVGATLPRPGLAMDAKPLQPSAQSDLVHLNLNENAYGPSPRVLDAITRELTRINRYGDTHAAEQLAEQIAAFEKLPVEQVLLGEILGVLGPHLGSQGGPGGEFIYSSPGYLALVDAAQQAGGVEVPVPLNAQYENDLPALSAAVTPRTRALYLINPHNPTGTVSDDAAFKRFLKETSQKAPVIVDEAYLEYTQEFESRSAVSLVREGANVLVFRTFDKIHGLAGLPLGYTLAPKELAATLRKQGVRDAEALGRINMLAGSIALADGGHVESVRSTVASERAKWFAVLHELKLAHTKSVTNFIFFDSGQPQSEVSEKMRKRGVSIARAFSPYINWARITIGLPKENQLAQNCLKTILGKSS
jgi:histidinol-phosphate aminotransferase